MTLAKGVVRLQILCTACVIEGENARHAIQIVARNNGIGKILLRLKFSFMRGEDEKSL